MVCVCVCVCLEKNYSDHRVMLIELSEAFEMRWPKLPLHLKVFFFSPPWAWGRGLGVPPNGRADSTWYVSYSGLKVMGVCTEQHRESATRPPVSSMAVSRQLLGVGVRVGGRGEGGTWGPLLFNFWTLVLSANPAHQTTPPYILISLSLWVGPLWPTDGVLQLCFLHLKTKDIKVSSPWKKYKQELTPRTRIHPGALFPPPANSVYIIPFLCLYPRKGIWETTSDFFLSV